MKKNLFFPALLISVVMLISISCKTKTPSDLSMQKIIPKPVSITATGDYFILKEKSSIYVYGVSEEMKKTGEYLAGILKDFAGYEPSIKTASGEPWSGNIFLSLENLGEIYGEEGYELTVTKKQVKLTATKPAGIIRGDVDGADPHGVSHPFRRAQPARPHRGVEVRAA